MGSDIDDAWALGHTKFMGFVGLEAEPSYGVGSPFPVEAPIPQRNFTSLHAPILALTSFFFFFIEDRNFILT